MGNALAVVARQLVLPCSVITVVDRYAIHRFGSDIAAVVIIIARAVAVVARRNSFELIEGIVGNYSARRRYNNTFKYSFVIFFFKMSNYNSFCLFEQIFCFKRFSGHKKRKILSNTIITITIVHPIVDNCFI